MSPVLPSGLFITQPAMSKTLQRLRDLYRDPLLVRSGRGLVPTPKAQELQRQLPDVLASIADLVRNKEFSPVKFTGTIRMAMPEFPGGADCSETGAAADGGGTEPDAGGNQ